MPRSPNTGTLVMHKILSIEELLDVPFFAPPSYQTSVINSRLTSVMATPTKDARSSFYFDENVGFKGGAFLRKRKEPEPSLYPVFEEVTDGLRKGFISWGQLNFSRETLSYLKRNIHLLDR